MVINGAQETFTGRYSFNEVIDCGGNFTGRAHEYCQYTKLRIVSLRTIN